MAKSFYDKYYKDQPPIFKGIINVVVVGGVAFGGYVWYRNWKHKKELEEANAAANLAANDLKKLQNQGVYPSFSDSQYEVLSQIIVQACNGCGTDEQAIYNVFGQLKNDADILKLINQFGVRYYQPCAADQPISYSVWLFNDQAYGGSLPTFLAYDLDASELQHINKILSDRHINYAF